MSILTPFVVGELGSVLGCGSDLIHIGTLRTWNQLLLHTAQRNKQNQHWKRKRCTPTELSHEADCVDRKGTTWYTIYLRGNYSHRHPDRLSVGKPSK